MNCPSCGTDEYYEGIFGPYARKCKAPLCKLYDAGHSEDCRKANEEPVKQTQAPDWVYTALGLPVPNRLGGLFQWMPSKNTVQPASKPPAFPRPIDIANMVDAGILTKSQGVDLIEKFYPDTDQVVFGPGSVSRTVFGPSKP